MKTYVADSFTSKLFDGNQAGVVLFENWEEFLSDDIMQKIAAELKHSETAFVKYIADSTYKIRYFTPVGEVPLCGHATIAVFSVLRDEKFIKNGTYSAVTLAGELIITVSESCIWMDMVPSEVIMTFDEASCIELYHAYGLGIEDKPEGFMPKLISTGLSDIMLPVKDKEILMKAVQNEETICAVSTKYDCVGVHMFCLSKEDRILAACSNFAPLLGIPEESATGTSNASLAYYLHEYGVIEENKEYLVIQGEHMGRRSEIRTKVVRNNNDIKIQVGGNAVILMECVLRI